MFVKTNVARFVHVVCRFDKIKYNFSSLYRAVERYTYYKKIAKLLEPQEKKKSPIAFEFSTCSQDHLEGTCIDIQLVLLK